MVFFGADGVLPTGAPDVRLPYPLRNGGAQDVIAVGDLTGDGVADIAVGSPAFNPRTGMVHVFPGGDALSSATLEVTTLVGGVANGHFGRGLAIADVTGDGKPDLIVGAVRDSAERVRIFPGPLAQGNIAANAATIVLSASQASSGFGAVAVGDYTGNGVADVIVGAPAQNTPAAGNLQAGAVFVFFGGTGLSTGGAGQADVVFEGVCPGGHSAGASRPGT